MRTFLMVLALMVTFVACRSSKNVRADAAAVTVADGGTSSEGAKMGEGCPDGRCAEGLSCIRYFGVAGPNGPQFSSCERPCMTDKCPAGERCVTIADGPGRVCRPE